MTRIAFALVLVAGLSACGVDGEPETPQPPPQVSGAVTISNNGIYPSVGLSRGWWSVNIGHGARW